MAQVKKEFDEMSEQEKAAEARNLPNRGGAVSDEDMKNSSGETEEKETGKDHSLDNYAETMPDEGVGAIQDSSLIKENVAHIEDEE